ncbi:hypothetical protein [Gracilibacillus xinjiangensis]|uniref:Uncharacterized protein n=1 Tax=Gracilibacillus xinjiangensis TaxID=1193282 RepID=A0ABV8WWB3_9BACI
MDGHLVKSVIMLTGSELKMLYILLINSPLSSVLSMNQVNFASYLEEQMEKLRSHNKEKMQVDIFLKMTELFKLKGLNYSNEKVLFEQSSYIFNQAFHQLSKDNKNLKQAISDNERKSIFIQTHFDKLFSKEPLATPSILLFKDVKVVKNVLSNNRFLSRSHPGNRLLEVIIAILLSKQVQDFNDSDLQLFLNEWQNRFNNYNTLHKQMAELEVERDGVQNDFDENQKIINEIQKQIRHAKQQISLEKKTLQSLLKYADLEKLQVNQSFETNRQAYEEIQQKIGRIYRSHPAQRNSDSFFSQISKTFSSIGTSIQIKNEERKASYYLSEMVEDILSSNVSFKEAEQKRIKDWEKKITDFKKWEKQHKKYQEMLKKELIQWKYQVATIKKNIKELEKENYGLADIPLELNQQLLLEE